MIEQDSPYRALPIAQAKKRVELKYPWMGELWFRVLALLMVAEIFTPFLQWPIGLPKLVMVGVEGIGALIIFLAFGFMLTKDRIPKGVLVVLGITFVWGIVGLFEGQSFAAFLWGWWRLFKYPLIGLFAYLVIGNPKGFAEWFIKFCMALLIFQVVVQFIMYAMGYPTGDDLAGTFGWRGVMQFTMMVFFVVCMGIGHWLGTNKLTFLSLSLLVGLVGTIMSGTKFYLFGVVLLLAAAFIINTIRGGQLRKHLMFILLFVVVATIFVPIYNRFNADLGGDRPLEAYLDPETAIRYLLYTQAADGRYYVGRGYAPIYAWQQLQRDETATLFGFGLGSRTRSSVLGVDGSGLAGDAFGGVSGSTLGTWMQEYGMVGIAVFLILIIWLTMQLFRYLRKRPGPMEASMTYGLILFTSFWPLWIWYHNVWNAGVMLTLYWVALGYILRQSLSQQRRPHRPSQRLLSGKTGTPLRKPID